MAKFEITWPDGTVDVEDCCDCHDLDNYMIRRFGGAETQAQVKLVEGQPAAPAKATKTKKDA